MRVEDLRIPENWSVAEGILRYSGVRTDYHSMDLLEIRKVTEALRCA